jgi:transitional endoplasmic reticulum ATPase
MFKKSTPKTTNTATTNEPGTTVQRHVDAANRNIVLPKGMPLQGAAAALMEQQRQDELVVTVKEEVHSYPLDAAYALKSVLDRDYGMQNLVTKKQMFGSNPPQMIGVNVGFEQTVQVPWGCMTVPGIQGVIETKISVTKENNPIMTIVGEVKRKDEKAIHELANKVRKECRENSIYRCSAIKISFPKCDWADVSLTDFNPKFVDLSSVRPDELIFSEALKASVSRNVFAPIRYSEACKKVGTPPKRGTLLAGPYGTGKTLTAMVAAVYAVENEWTFLYITDPHDLPKAIKFSELYGRTVIFCEDIDQAFYGTGGKRSVEDGTSELVNIADGIESKHRELIMVFTTNHEDIIDKAMLRTGRIDSIIRFTPPDAEAAQVLLRQYGRGLIPADEDLAEVGKALDGFKPSDIREAVERSKYAALDRSGGDPNIVLTADDLLGAAHDMQEHIEMVKPEEPDERSEMEKAADTLGEWVHSAITGQESDEAEAEEVQELAPASFDA